jgi:hypothetical protein
MTVAEYIELLKKLPQDAIVKRAEYQYDYREGDRMLELVTTDEVVISKEGDFLVNY